MREKFQQTITQLGCFSGSNPVIVGVSGGADSLALLHLMKESGLNVISVHYNHNLRPESTAEASLLTFLLSQMGLQCVVGEGDVSGYAAMHGLTIEAAGRLLRYRFLFEQAERFAAQAVVVAHHADDQVETVLLHLLRGSGLNGLQGMLPVLLPNPWSTKIALVRPLLGFWKSELEAYCLRQKLEPVQDLSNFNTGFLRNRLRHELIPLLETYQPALRPALLRLSEIAQGEQALIIPQVENAWQLCILQTGTNYVALHFEKLNSQPKGMQRLLCRRALAILRPGLPDIDFLVVEHILEFLRASGTRRQSDLAGGLRLFLEGNTLWLATWEADLPADGWPQLPNEKAALQVISPGDTRLTSRWLLRCTLVDTVEIARQQAAENPNPYQAWLDLDQCEGVMQLRPRWTGARFQSLGLDGHSQKLSDLMINARLPQRARALWPLLCVGELILWVPGLALAHSARLTEQTRQVLHVKLAVDDNGENQSPQTS